VSVTTASRALRGLPYVKAGVLEKIQAVAAELGYHANEGARSLRSSQTMTLGVVCYQLRQLPMIEFLDGFAAGAEEAGYAVFSANARASDEQAKSLIGRLFERRVDGLFVDGTLMASPELGASLKPYQDTGVPVLMGMSRGTLESDVPLVITSEFDAVRQAVARIVELKHRSLAYFGAPRTLLTPRPSYLTRAASEFGILCHMSFHPESTDADAMAHHITNALAAPTAATVLAVNHSLLSPFIKAIRMLRLRFPEDVSIFTFSDYQAVDTFIEPPLAAIHSDAVTMGIRAAGIITKWIESGEPPPHVTDVNLSSWVDSPSMGPPASHLGTSQPDGHLA
jgi:LacI family transcriptional regulator